MSETPLHDWLRPRVQRLLEEARAAGFPRDMVVAVLLDVAGGTGLNTAPPPAEPPPPRGPWPSPTDDLSDPATPDLDRQLPNLAGRMP